MESKVRSGLMTNKADREDGDKLYTLSVIVRVACSILREQNKCGSARPVDEDSQ
jgi:hypothetical protein